MISITNEEIIFMTTNENKEIRRRVPIKMVSGISKKIKKDSKSLVLHIRGGADEFFYTNDRDDIIDLIKRIYAYERKLNLPIFAPAESQLMDYCTNEEEAAKGMTRMPDRKLALEEENVYIEQINSEVPDKYPDEVNFQDFKNYEEFF